MVPRAVSNITVTVYTHLFLARQNPCEGTERTRLMVTSVEIYALQCNATGTRILNGDTEDK